MKLLSIFLFAVLFFFQAALGLHLGDAGIRGRGLPSTFDGSRGHGGPGGRGGPGGPGGQGGPPPPPPTNATTSSGR